jgi:hypothetical protein
MLFSRRRGWRPVGQARSYRPSQAFVFACSVHPVSSVIVVDVRVWNKRVTIARVTCTRREELHIGLSKGLNQYLVFSRFALGPLCFMLHLGALW